MGAELQEGGSQPAGLRLWGGAAELRAQQAAAAGWAEGGVWLLQREQSEAFLDFWGWRRSEIKGKGPER